MMRQSIQRGRSRPLAAEDLDPVGKTQVGSHDQCDPLVRCRPDPPPLRLTQLAYLVPLRNRYPSNRM